MTAARHSFDRSAGRLGTARGRWYPLQGGLLGAGLVAFAVVMYLGAAPRGAALRSSPPSSLAGGEDAAAQPHRSPSAASPPAQRHLVLLVSDEELGLVLQRRILAGEIVYGEFGAYAPPLTGEVLLAAADDSVPALIEGRREFEAQCVSEPCAAMHVLDLRTPAPD